MARSSAQPFVWVGAVALLVVVTVVGLQFVDSGPGDAPGTAVVSAADAGAGDAHPPRRSAPRPIAPVKPLDAGVGLDTRGVYVAPSSRGLTLFRDQAQADVRRLGSQAGDMERLWKIGRFTGNSVDSNKALQDLIDKYGDTHRATCARYLLHRNLLLHGSGDLDARRQAAVDGMNALIEADPDSRCDSGTRASQLARFLLATQVYRHTDFERSVELLKEVAGAEPDEVDNLGVSLPIRARAILKEVEEGAR
jgi:hypothetical protein